MKKAVLLSVLGLSLAVLSLAAGVLAAPDFSGTWQLNVSKSKNIGMMSTMQITLKIKQTGNEVTVSEFSKFNGQERTRELHYDLTGKLAANTGPMGDPSDTVTKWVGDTLQTTWTQEGAVAGSKVARTETRSLSSDGKTMTDEYVRGSNPPMIMVFDKQ